MQITFDILNSEILANKILAELKKENPASHIRIKFNNPNYLAYVLVNELELKLHNYNVNDFIDVNRFTFNPLEDTAIMYNELCRVIRKISGYLVVFRKIISDNVHYELIYTDNARINTHKLFENIYE